jgi:hypothetical protein
MGAEQQPAVIAAARAPNVHSDSRRKCTTGTDKRQSTDAMDGPAHADRTTGACAVVSVSRTSIVRTGVYLTRPSTPS